MTRPDHTDDRPAAEKRYSREDVNRARQDLSDRPRRPRVKSLRVLRHVDGLPFAVDSILVQSFDIREGNPQHGEMRSDDHISGLQVKGPIHLLSREDDPEKCPKCGHDYAVYSYHAYHNISGGFSLTCTRCEETIAQDEWA